MSADNGKGRTPVPEWVKDYVETESTRAQWREITLHLMEDHGNAMLTATNALSRLYQDLCNKRRRIDIRDIQDHAFEEDIHSSVIDKLMGAYLVLLQAEIARVISLVKACTADGGRLLRDHEVRNLHDTRFGPASTIELIWQLANAFKHDDQISAGETSGSPTDEQVRTMKTVDHKGIMKRPMAHDPGGLETKMCSSLGCSQEEGLSPAYTEVRLWREGLAERIKRGGLPIPT